MPPLVGFAIYFVALHYSGLYFTLKIDEMGGGMVRSFLAYYRYFLTLLFIVGVLTQIVITIPAWNTAFKYERWYSKLADIIGLCFLCLVFAAGLCYPICDVKNDFPHYRQLVLFMTGIQIGYWVINLLILYLIDHSTVKTPTDAGSQLVDE